MDIHKPKPWHGVREFLKEYVIIVVGVLTALAAEQVVEGMRTREAVDALRDSLRTELVENRARWEANRSQDECVAKRLDAILTWAAASPPQALTTLVGVPITYNVHASAWDSAKANPASIHMPPAEHSLYAQQYDGLAGSQRDLDIEHRGWIEIQSLLEQGDSPEDKRALRKLVIVEKDALARRRSNYAKVFARFDALHIPAEPQTLVSPHGQTLLCAPLVTAPARRGQNG